MAVVSTNAIAADESGRDPRRLYDRQTECAVFDTRGFEANAATWDGPCVHGLADGRGTATYFGRNGSSEAVSADFRDGILVDGKADIRWSDGAHYAGDVEDGEPDGSGVLVNAKGDRFDGVWKGGQLNGRGSVAWANGDRYEGDWVDGKAEGRGIQIWADGQKYDGPWHNDQPNGQGTVTRRDGSTFIATFVDGKRQEIAAAAAPQPATPAPPPQAPTSATSSAAQAGATGISPQLLDGMLGRTLTGVDGSTVSVATTEGGVVRTLTAADGTVQTSVFAFLGPNLGTVADQVDPRRVTGVFRITTDGVAIEYSDGRSEILRPDPSGGLLATVRSAAGATACASWYPQGHVFSVAERKAAVAAYARRLGVSDLTPPVASCAGQLISASIPGGRVPMRRTVPAPPRAANLPAALPTPKPANSSGLQPVPVKDSTVHLIDATAAGPAMPSGTIAPPPADERIASNCLHVDSDGNYWGFRNHCGYSVQFAYCLLHGVNPMTTCADKGGVVGSVSANGFGALFADESLAERDAEHQFRWVGCRGGAGEVIAELDHADPASGQCVRTKTAQRDN